MTALRKLKLIVMQLGSIHFSYTAGSEMGLNIMANTTQNNSNLVGIKQSWTLVDFAKSRGTMKIAPFVNKETGEAFTSCVFTTPGKPITIVNFSSNLGELSAKQIAMQQDSLQVVELDNGKFKLCKQGADAWQTVNLHF